MERKKDLTERYSILFLYVIFIVGIIGHNLEITKKLMIEITQYILILCSIVVLYSIRKNSDRKILVWILFTFIFSFMIEVLGVQTKAIFGDYSYGNVFTLKLFEVPLIIGLNWMFVILGSILIAREITSPKYLQVLLTGVFAVLFDFFLEPVAIKLDYWQWMAHNIPLQNYAAWFLIAVIASLFYSKINPGLNLKIPKHYFFAQFIFFLCLNIFLK